MIIWLLYLNQSSHENGQIISFLIENFWFLFPQMMSSDKDFRFMATNDLMGELQKDSIKLDDDSERKVSVSSMHILS